METLIIEVAKVLWAKADPMLILCVLVLIVIQHRDRKASEALRQRLDAHLNPDPKENPYPHPQCKEGDDAYTRLCSALENQHRENREDHQEIFKLLRGEK